MASRIPEPLPIAWIPNQDGFRFVGVKADGERVRFQVSRGEDGCHHADAEDFVTTLDDLVGWEHERTYSPPTLDDLPF